MDDQSANALSVLIVAIRALVQQQLFQAQSQYSQARHQFVLSGLQLKQAAGVVEGKDLESVNALLE